MNDLDRATFERQQAAVTEVEYVLTSPFRMLFAVFKWAALITAVVLWSTCVWVFNLVGGQGMSKRQAVADHIFDIVVNYPNAPDTDWFLDTVYLDQRPDPFPMQDGHLVMPEDHYTVSFVAPYEDHRISHAAFEHSVAGVRSFHGTPTCASGGDYSVTSGSWETRNQSALDHKSAVMAAAYDNGVIMASAMRRVFTIMKQFPDAPIRADNMIFQPGNSVSLCNADPVFPGITQQEYETETNISRSIQIYAPRVEVLHWHGQIVSLCLVQNCGMNALGEGSTDLTYRVTWLADIFGHKPPITRNQARAVERMNWLSTDEAWLMEAHNNDIYEDAKVLRMAGFARQYRDRIMWPEGQPQYLDIK